MEEDLSLLVPLRMLIHGYGGEVSPDHRQLALVPTTTSSTSRFKLPDDWVVQESPRSDASRIDKYYYEPESGQKFRSLRAVERHLTGEVYTPRLKALKLGNCFKNSGTRKMVVSGGKLDEEEANQLQLAFVASTSSTASPDFELPEGWIVEAIPRKDRRYTDKYYYEPGTGRKFRSLVSVERYLTEFDDNAPLCEAFKLVNHVQKSGWQKKKISREKLKTSILNSADPPVKINWVLTGPEGDTWSPFMGESMVPDSVKQQWTKRFISSINDGNYNVPDFG
ncbi:methyl-CpG-binding domain-containing protein 7-like isoform X2 [Cornus florida]|uniref:methyl-CpG-binding domain-containing protein 7-like isoform X2 n=1 Tax=Cornus florida TaxID=4283 RepID=UPI002898AE1C|nr:methyl-CpG-binding domain-containing protein 7-like isoform X2 [Cornus florida]